jgi:excisionase family DNA binding protein
MANSKVVFSVDEFRERYGVGKTTIYEEIRAGRLMAMKVGRRTIITEEDGQNWLRSLPKANDTRLKVPAPISRGCGHE